MSSPSDGARDVLLARTVSAECFMGREGELLGVELGIEGLGVLTRSCGDDRREFGERVSRDCRKGESLNIAECDCDVEDSLEDV